MKKKKETKRKYKLSKIVYPVIAVDWGEVVEVGDKCPICGGKDDETLMVERDTYLGYSLYCLCCGGKFIIKLFDINDNDH